MQQIAKGGFLSRKDIGLHKSSWSKEIIGGTQTFFTMAYILIVQPQILSMAGMPTEIVFASTAFFSFLATFCMGVYGRFPFALSTGMGSNIIFATSVAAGVFTWQEGMGIVFYAGVLFLITSFPLGKKGGSLRGVITDNIPVGLKFGFAAVIGLFLADLGFGNAGLVQIVDNTKSAASIKDPLVAFIWVVLIVTAFLLFGFHVVKNKKNGNQIYKWVAPGAVLIGMLAITLVFAFTGHISVGENFSFFTVPANPFAFFPKLIGNSDFWLSITRPGNWTYIIIFYLSDLLSTTSTSIGCSARAGFMDENGNVEGIERIFVVDSAFTAIAGVFGLTGQDIYVESAAGVEAGARTGWAAVTTSAWFFLSLFFAPVFLLVPTQASGMALILVGISMMFCLKDIKYDSPEDAVPVLLMIITTAYTGDFAIAMCIGLIASPLWQLFTYIVYPLVCGIKKGKEEPESDVSVEEPLPVSRFSKEIHKKMLPAIPNVAMGLLCLVNLLVA